MGLSLPPPQRMKSPSTLSSPCSKPFPTLLKAAKKAQEAVPTSMSAFGVAVERLSSAATIWSTMSKHTLASSRLRVRLSMSISISDSGQFHSFFPPLFLLSGRGDQRPSVSKGYPPLCDAHWGFSTQPWKALQRSVYVEAYPCTVQDDQKLYLALVGLIPVIAPPPGHPRLTCHKN